MEEIFWGDDEEDLDEEFDFSEDDEDMEGLEFEDEENFIIFLKFIKTIKELKIEYIYYNNSIIYCSKKYFNGISDREYDKTKLINSIENNKKNFKKINNILNFE